MALSSIINHANNGLFTTNYWLQHVLMYKCFRFGPEHIEPTKALDSSLKRHTALIKRMRQSMGMDNNEQIMKDIASLSLEKYVDELAGATLEGIARCKTERDVWSAVEVRAVICTPKQLCQAIQSCRLSPRYIVDFLSNLRRLS